MQASFRVLCWIWVGIIAVLALGIFTNWLFSPMRPFVQEFMSIWAFWILTALGILAIVTLSLFLIIRNLNAAEKNKQLLSEFEICCDSENISPEMFKLQEVKLGDRVGPSSFRPLFTTAYVQRRFMRYEDPSLIIQEEDLLTYVKEGKEFVLLAQPTEGKSTSLFFLLRQLKGFTVIKPFSNALPSEKALSMLTNKKVIMLMDNLTDYINIDLNYLYTAIRMRTTTLSVVTACRSGNELRTQILDRPGTLLHRFYGDIAIRLQFIPLITEEKQNLAQNIGKTLNPKQIDDFPTPGWITMEDAFKQMQERFAELQAPLKDTLRAIKMLFGAGIYPLSHDRLRGVMEDLYGYNAQNFILRECLETLAEHDFIAKPGTQDPVYPEHAYLHYCTDSLQSFSPDERRARIQSSFSALTSSFEKRKDVSGLLQLSIVFSIGIHDDALALFCIQKAIDLQPGFVEALVLKGMLLRGLDQIERAIGTYDEVIAKIGDPTTPALRNMYALALVDKSGLLYKLEKTEEAITGFNDVITKFGNETEMVLRKQVANALINKGTVMANLNQIEKAIDAFNELVTKFGDSTSLDLKENVARSLLSLGLELEKLNQIEKAIAAYNEVVTRFGNATEMVLKEWVAKALYTKGFALGEHNQMENATATFNEVVTRFGNTTEQALKKWVARVLVDQGSMLDKYDQTGNAIATLNEVITRFGDATEPELRISIAEALINKGVMLDKLNQTENAIATFNEVVTRFANTTEQALKEWVAKALFNIGVMQDELNQTEKAIAAYNEVVTQFGSETDPAMKEIVAKAYARTKQH